MKIKQPKALTRTQKEILSNHDMNAKEWGFVGDLGSYIKVAHKQTGKIKIVDKYKKKGKVKNYDY